MTLLRASLVTGIATVVRMATGLVLNKVLAVYIGPAGLGQVAQLTNLAGIASGIATGGVTTGVTRYVAEHGDLRRSASLVSTGLAVVLVAGFLTSLFLVLLSPALASAILGSRDHAWLLWILAGANLITAFCSLGTAILNGQKAITAIASIGILAALLSLVVGISLTVTHGLDGALAAACLAPALPAVGLSLYLHFRPGRLSLLTWTKPDQASLWLLGRYSIMAITSAIAGPTSVLLVRNYLATEISWDAAGHWQGVWRISEVYLSIVTTSLSVYFLPRLAELKETSALRQELRRGLGTAVPVVVAAAILIYLLRDWITTTLYSAAFLPMTVLFPLQLCGDVVKIAGWLFAYLMLARAMMFAYVVTEILFSATFFGLAIALVSKYGLVGVSYAHALNYAAYLLVVWYLTRPLLNDRVSHTTR